MIQNRDLPCRPYMALENIVGTSLRRRWIIAGPSSGLRLQLADISQIEDTNRSGRDEMISVIRVVKSVVPGAG
jgi:hypothetical protein